MFDVIIVGAGVSGSYLAQCLNQMDPNLNLLLLEKDKKVILKDSGIVSTRFGDFFKTRGLVKNRVKQMDILSPNGVKISLTSPDEFAYILDRKRFSEHLRKGSRKVTKIRYETVRKIKHFPGFTNVITDKNEYRCKMVVGADGAASFVRSCVGIGKLVQYTGIMVRSNHKFTGEIKIFMNKYFSPDFFSWIIPQNNEYGLMSSIRPMDYLQYYRKTKNLPDGDLHVFPMSMGFTKTYDTRTLLVGDSACQTKPITGGGIIFSLLSVKHAVSVIERAFEENHFDKNFFSCYEFSWKSELGKEIKKQLFFRKLYRKFSNRDIDTAFKKFGSVIDNLDDFDYDRMSTIIKKLPKWELFKFMLPRLGLLF